MDFANINGVTIHYKYLKGIPKHNAADKTFVFINSLGTDFRIWEGVVELLKDEGNILLYDKRGHGLSDTASNANGLIDYADELEMLLNHLEIKNCILIGLSVGGMIAQILASRQSVNIEKLILCDTRHIIGNAQIWNDRISEVKEHGLISIADGVMQRWFSESFRNKEAVKINGYKNMLVRTPEQGYTQTCEAIRDADLTAMTQKIKIPALCIVGSEDRSTTPEEVKAMADLIEGSTYKIISGSGHIPCVDNAEVLSNLIIDFVK